MSNDWRKSHHPLVPVTSAAAEAGSYGLYPTFPLQDSAAGGISVGHDELAALIVRQVAATGNVVRIDGGSGVMWQPFVHGLNESLERLGASAEWLPVAGALKSSAELDKLVAPHLGGEDPIFGRRFEGSLRDFFGPGLGRLVPGSPGGLTIVYGTGAALVGGTGPLLYLDVPKNEVQYRLRAGSVAPLGTEVPARPEPKPAYKRLFFVDWPLLERHVSELASDVTLFVDTQDPHVPRTITGTQLRTTLRELAASPFRARPWFEIGPWGGQWLKENLPQLPREEENYAWSFELITPENGLLLSDGENQLEVAFEWLMALESERVLGEAAGRFGRHFPIRFNYLDTVHGGNLSVQVHPSKDYVRKNFGHGLTQDETYYVVTTRESGPEPVVYLGFRQDVDLAEFGQALQHSLASGEELDVDRFVNHVPARKHDLYLIPNGTIHSAGEGSLVLEISATTYLFTMKLYDWQRLDVDGKPRPINLERGMANLDATITPEVVEREHISRPLLLASGAGWQLLHLPTHERHFFDVHRFELEPGAELEVRTDSQFHVLNVVEGQLVNVIGAGGHEHTFSFAETFVVPAATDSYRLRNDGNSRALVVKAFVKPGRGEWSTSGGIMES